MDRKIFMVLDDLKEVFNELKDSLSIDIYLSEGYEEKIKKVTSYEKISSQIYEKNGIILIGKSVDEYSILARTPAQLTRKDIVDYVKVCYQGEKSDVMAATFFTGFSSNTTKIVKKEMDKILRKKYHKGITGYDEQGNQFFLDYYWSQKALDSGKKWYLFFRKSYRTDGLKPLY